MIVKSGPVHFDLPDKMMSHIRDIAQRKGDHVIVGAAGKTLQIALKGKISAIIDLAQDSGHLIPVDPA